MKEPTYEQLKYQRDTAKAAVETWMQATRNLIADRDALTEALRGLEKEIKEFAESGDLATPQWMEKQLHAIRPYTTRKR